MKKEYVKPEMEITEFETEDVIITSDTNPYDGEGKGGGED